MSLTTCKQRIEESFKKMYIFFLLFKKFDELDFVIAKEYLHKRVL